MIKVGITGGIGSGKTTFCKVWEELGAYVLYADDFAKELMSNDKELRKNIKATFGENAYTKEEGELNRSYLAEEAFEKGRVDELNALVHPILWKRTEELAEKKAKEGVKVFAKEAAILLNEGRPDNLDYVIMLLSGEEERTHRVMIRDKSDREQILSRMEKQPIFEDITHLSDFVVVNDGSLEELRIKAGELYKTILELND